MNLTRRRFTLGVSLMALAAGIGRAAAAQDAAALNATLPRAYEGVTLRIQLGTGPVFDAIKTLTADFTAATGIEVEFTGLSYTESYQKLILDLTSGSASFDGFAFAYQWKTEMAPFMLDLARIPEEVEGAPSLALDDYPGDVMEVYGTVDGKVVGLPILGDVTMMVWNTAGYEQAGLDPASAPASWEEVAERGAKLTGDGKYGFGLPAGKASQTFVIWILVHHAMGGSYFDAEGVPAFNSPEGKQAMRFIVEKLQPLAPPGNLTWDFPEMLTALQNGTSTQSMMWPGGFNAMLDPAQSAAAADLAYAPTPMVSLLGGWSIGLNAASANPEAAKLYAAWLASPEITKAYALLGGSPARTSALTDPEVVALQPHAPAVLAGLSGNVAQFPPVPSAEQILIMIQDEVNAAASGVKTPDQAADELQAKVVEFMATL